jgi:hypothetical protein
VAYAYLAEVQDAIPGFVLTANTVPSEDQASALIDLISAEIDGLLASRDYVLPVTDPGALLLLKTTCVYGSASLIYKAWFAGNDGISGDNGAAKFFEDKYQGLLQNIREGALGDTAASDAVSFGSGFITTEFDKYEPWIRRETVDPY